MTFHKLRTPLSNKFHWFVAWRYLMERRKKFSPVILWIAVGLIVWAVAGLITATLILEQPNEYMFGSPFRDKVLFVSLALVALAERTLTIGMIRYVFTFFTTVSIAGLVIGTGALVVVLSVMGGFETDIRNKILGSNAHIRITKEDGAFTEYREVAEKVRSVPGVTADTPYLSSEVVVVVDDNWDTVVIKGIQPSSVSAVTDLGKYIHEPGALQQLSPLSDASVDGLDAGVPKVKGIDAGRVRVDANPPLDPAPGDMQIDDSEPVDLSRDPAPAIIDPAPSDMEIGDEPPIDLSGNAPVASTSWWMESEDVDLAPLQDGLPPELAALPGLIVGDELVNKIRLHVGQEVRVVSPLAEDTPMGPVPRTRSYRIAGTFYTGMYEYDLKFVYVELSSLQQFLDVQDEVTGIEVRVRDPDTTEQILATIRSRLGATYRVQDWKELNRSLFAALKLEKIAMFLVLVIIILVASLSIVGNLIMVVVEKAKEIAVLKTMGASNSSIRRLFVTHGLGIGLVGTVLGVGWGLLFSLLIAKIGVPLNPDVYYIDRLPIQVEPLIVFAVAMAGVILSAVATVYPAALAARVRPIEGMRDE